MFLVIISPPYIAAQEQRRPAALHNVATSDLKPNFSDILRANMFFPKQVAAACVEFQSLYSASSATKVLRLQLSLL